MHALPDRPVRHATSLAEAAAWLHSEPGARIIAGGTDLLPNLRRGLGATATLVDVSRIAGFGIIEPQADGALVIGAGATLASLASDAWVMRELPALADAARSVAAAGHRSAATVGGNLCQDTRCVYYNQSEWWRDTLGHCLKYGGTRCHVAPQGERCHAAFCSDLAPALLVLGARVMLLSARGERTVLLSDCYRDDGAAHLAFDGQEVLVRVLVPAPGAEERFAFAKARARDGIDFPLASVAVALSMQEGRVAQLRIALAGTNSHPLLLEGMTSLHGRAVDDALVQQVARAVQKQVSPMRSSAVPPHYRRQVASVLAQRLVRELAREPLATTTEARA